MSITESLDFTPFAWRKMKYLRDKGDTEVSFFAITKENDISIVENVLMVPQRCSWAYTEFDDIGVADFYDKMVDQGYPLERFSRIWCHTHPGNSASPSTKDEETFKRVFGRCAWAIMFILAKDGSTTCRLRYGVQPISEHFPVKEITKELKVYVNYDTDFFGVNEDVRKEWDAEYERCWHKMEYSNSSNSSNGTGGNGKSQSSFPGNNYGTSNYSGSGRYQNGGWYSPGWYKEGGSWLYTSSAANEHKKLGFIKHSPWVQPTTGDWRKMYHQSTETGESEIAKYQRKMGRVPTNNYGDLTKRERKYLKKHKTLAGFEPFPNSGKKGDTVTPSQMKKLEHVERLRLGEALDDPKNWLMEAREVLHPSLEEDKERLFDVTLEGRFGGPTDGENWSYKGVPARNSVEAIDMVHDFFGLPLYKGEVTCNGEVVRAAIPGYGKTGLPLDANGQDDTELELLPLEDDKEETVITGFQTIDDNGTKMAVLGYPTNDDEFVDMDATDSELEEIEAIEELEKQESTEHAVKIAKEWFSQNGMSLDDERILKEMCEAGEITQAQLDNILSCRDSDESNWERKRELDGLLAFALHDAEANGTATTLIPSPGGNAHNDFGGHDPVDLFELPLT